MFDIRVQVALGCCCCWWDSFAASVVHHVLNQIPSAVRWCWSLRNQSCFSFCYRPLKGFWMIWAVVIINNHLGFIWPHNEWQSLFLCMSVYCCKLLYDMGVWKKYWSGIFLCSMFCGQWLLLVWQRTVIESISLARRIQVPAAVMQHMNCNC